MNQRVQLQVHPLREQLSQLVLAPAGTLADPHGPPRHDQPLLETLWHAAAKLLEAVDSALNGDRASAEDYINSVGVLLQAAAPRAAKADTAVSSIPLHTNADTRCERTASARPQTPIRGGLAPWQVRQVATHIDSQLGDSITTDDLARITRLSACHFSRAFRESFGDSPHKYVMRRRVERAQELMLATELSLGQIAIECGLADQAHLCKLFLKIVGESPGVWRRAHCSPMT